MLLPVLLFALAAPSAGFRVAPRAAKARLSPRMVTSPESILSDIPPCGTVSVKKTTHELTFVQDVDHIDSGPIIDRQDVEAYEISNDLGVSFKVMRQGACIVNISKNGKNYVWNNKEGACYYGAGKDAFPLNRGLILHGGIRFAVVTAEHGLFYDTDWPWEVREASDGSSASIVFRMKDTEETRAALKRDIDPDGITLSGGQYNIPDGGRMSYYPVTNMDFTMEVTLRANEEFVRIKCTAENNNSEATKAEVWLPQTYPCTMTSKVISRQVQRWKRDLWCFPEEAQLVTFPGSEYEKPLAWPTSGIFYDFPYVEGGYHGVSLGDGSGGGAVFVTRDEPGYHTKMWSWGDKANFNRETADTLAKGRPATEYYEPWSSASSFAFFQTMQFPPYSKLAWEGAVLPIESGLNDEDTVPVLCAKVEEQIRLKNVKVMPIESPTREDF